MSSTTSKMGFDLTHHCLRVKNLSAVAKFYSEKFGMKQINQSLSNEDVVFSGFTSDIDESSKIQRGKTLLELHELKSNKATSKQSQETYWKIGVCLQDVKYGCNILKKSGVHVGSPNQFLDIGYLTHLSDSDGFTIELLQTDFENNYRPITPDPRYALDQPAVLGQITIRASNADKTLQFYQNQLGMKLLSIQPVTPYGFTLYFLAWTDDVPPSSELTDVIIREWLWKRPYTTIEIQISKRGGKIDPFSLDANKTGFMGMRAVCNNLAESKAYFESVGLKIENGYDDVFNVSTVTVRDPDNIPITFMEG